LPKKKKKKTLWESSTYERKYEKPHTVISECPLIA
jgi:hypothetical protein